MIKLKDLLYNLNPFNYVLKPKYSRYFRIKFNIQKCVIFHKKINDGFSYKSSIHIGKEGENIKGFEETRVTTRAKYGKKYIWSFFHMVI